MTEKSHKNRSQGEIAKEGWVTNIFRALRAFLVTKGNRLRMGMGVLCKIRGLKR